MTTTQAIRPSSRFHRRPPGRFRVESPKVLLVEDHQSLRETLTRSLEENGCEVVGASDGARGFREFLRNTPDIVVLDVQLPDVHGLKVLGEIRQREPDIPIVIMTTTMAPVYSAIPSVVVLRKPFVPEKFLEEVRRALSNAKKRCGTSARRRRLRRPD